MSPIVKISEPNHYNITNNDGGSINVTEHYGSFYNGTYFADQVPCELDVIKKELVELEWITKVTARHEYFMSLTDRDYTYGNRNLGAQKYSSKPFSKEVEEMRTWLNWDLGTKFNVCFLNKYDNEHQHLGWHADDFEGMMQDEPIAVISFGAEREIWVKDKRGFFYNDTWNSTPPNSKQPAEQRIKLQEGSLFLMPVGYQDTHLHRIPKHDRACGWRISLTFRSFS